MVRRVFVALYSLLLLACPLAPATVPCGDKLCPEGAVCVQAQCTPHLNLLACSGKAAGAACHGYEGEGVCSGEVCVVQMCGNGQLELTEACDDGNRVDGDGCARDCLSNETCGNGVVDVDEGCDCGTAAAPNPRCAYPNSDQLKAECTMTCRSRGCGDGIKNGLEDCDDDDIGGATCSTLGLYGGDLRCNGLCRWNLESCERCGDNRLNGNELCETIVTEDVSTGTSQQQVVTTSDAMCTSLAMAMGASAARRIAPRSSAAVALSIGFRWRPQAPRFGARVRPTPAAPTCLGPPGACASMATMPPPYRREHRAARSGPPAPMRPLLRGPMAPCNA